MPKADFVCTPRLRVRWAEVDMQKIVFNGHYLTYIDTAVAEYCCRVARLGRSSMSFAFEIYRAAEDAPLVTAELVYVNADPATMKAVPLPEELRARVTKYERRAPQA